MPVFSQLNRFGSENVIDNKQITISTDHDEWFREQVQQALDDPRPDIPSEEVEAYFAKRRAASLIDLGAELLD